MTRARKLVVLGVLAGTLFAIAIAAASGVAWYRQHEREQAIALTREWARLAPFPQQTTALEISTEGGAFTRAFRTSFRAPPALIERWLLDSPGTREAQPEHLKTGARKYQIRPGGGASGAELTVGAGADTVSIYVYWS